MPDVSIFIMIGVAVLVIATLAATLKIIRQQQVALVERLGKFRKALEQARSEPGPVLVHVETDPLVPAPSSGSWWDVPVSQVSRLESTQQAYAEYERDRAGQRHYLN